VETHSSLNYLIIGCAGGRIRFFSFKEKKFLIDWNFDMRIECKFKALILDITQDPSGLFLVTSGVSPKKIKQTLSLNSSLQIMEIGTGVTFDAGCQIFGISFIKWMEGGRFVILGTREGKIYVTEATTDIAETILDATE
jgi:hypothetical protein